MNETRWWKYMQQLMGDQSQFEAAKFIGIARSNLTRWKDGVPATPQFVVKVARAYGANVVEALAAAEIITDKEAALRHVESDGPALHSCSDEQLAEELLRRLNLLSADVVSFPRRSNKRAHPLSSTSDIPSDAVADSSPDEDWEGAEFD